MSKNTRNRILLTALAALLLVTLTIGGTIAWLTDKTTTVTNEFTTSHVDVELAETKTNFKMVPGATIEKDPTVTVKAISEACWVFVKVTATNTSDYLNYTIADGWTKLEDGVYYREVSDTDADQTFAVLKDNQVTVLKTVTNTQMTAAETNKPTLAFTAYAVQKEGFSTAAAAWNEVKDTTEQYPAPVVTE